MLDALVTASQSSQKALVEKYERAMAGAKCDQLNYEMQYNFEKVSCKSGFSDVSCSRRSLMLIRERLDQSGARSFGAASSHCALANLSCRFSCVLTPILARLLVTLPHPSPLPHTPLPLLAFSRPVHLRFSSNQYLLKQKTNSDLATRTIGDHRESVDDPYERIDAHQHADCKVRRLIFSSMISAQMATQLISGDESQLDSDRTKAAEEACETLATRYVTRQAEFQGYQTAPKGVGSKEERRTARHKKMKERCESFYEGWNSAMKATHTGATVAGLNAPLEPDDLKPANVPNTQIGLVKGTSWPEFVDMAGITVLKLFNLERARDQGTSSQLPYSALFRTLGTILASKTPPLTVNPDINPNAFSAFYGKGREWYRAAENKERGRHPEGPGHRRYVCEGMHYFPSWASQYLESDSDLQGSHEWMYETLHFLLHKYLVSPKQPKFSTYIKTEINYDVDQPIVIPPGEINPGGYYSSREEEADNPTDGCFIANLWVAVSQREDFHPRTLYICPPGFKTELKQTDGEVTKCPPDGGGAEDRPHLSFSHPYIDDLPAGSFNGREGRLLCFRINDGVTFALGEVETTTGGKRPGFKIKVAPWPRPLPTGVHAAIDDEVLIAITGKAEAASRSSASLSWLTSPVGLLPELFPRNHDHENLDTWSKSPVRRWFLSWKCPEGFTRTKEVGGQNVPDGADYYPCVRQQEAAGPARRMTGQGAVVGQPQAPTNQPGRTSAPVAVPQQAPTSPVAPALRPPSLSVAPALARANSVGSAVPAQAARARTSSNP